MLQAIVSFGLMSTQELDLVTVATPDELVNAILEDRRHIVITAHLDLTTLLPRQNSLCPDGCASPLPEVLATDSIRVCMPLHHRLAPDQL